MTDFPMSATRTVILISALLAGVCSASAVETKDQGIIFAVRDYSRIDASLPAGKRIQTLIEPVAHVVDGKLAQLPDEVDLKQFEQRYYSKHQRYTLFAGGRAGGSVEVRHSAFDVECESLAADALVLPVGKVAGRRMALASNVPFHDLDYTRRAASDAERSAIINLATHVYTDNGIGVEATAKAQVSNITAIENKSGSVLIGSFIVHRKLKEDDETTDAVFLIAEMNGDRIYGTTYAWFASGSEESIQVQNLVDVLDIDGTGFPYVVTEINGYESTEYHVYRKSQGKWWDFFKQSAGGC